MITKLRIDEIEAKKLKDGPSEGFDVLFNWESVKVEKDEIKLRFSYTAEYKNGFGYIRVKGELNSKEDKETMKKVEAELKNKKLPQEYMQKVVNTVNYFGTTNATVISTVLNVMPPIRMPTLQFEQKQEAKK